MDTLEINPGHAQWYAKWSKELRVSAKLFELENSKVWVIENTILSYKSNLRFSIIKKKWLAVIIYIDNHSTWLGSTLHQTFDKQINNSNPHKKDISWIKYRRFDTTNYNSQLYVFQLEYPFTTSSHSNIGITLSLTIFNYFTTII